ncbi:SART-1 family protein DOT2 [Cladorrhinum samala]|uniref:SART-1 family protein DOT2 n=1 Tax=Cladorrhinum samala TaxID=585594 RepID=A0AAV9HMC2_9PEZI|nr:SART-1 family protein DOT2 [Cladorrhinum samala]
MDAASIEEINKVRRAMGMKPLPVPGAPPPPKEATPEPEDGEKTSTLETREAAGYDNYKKALEAEEKKRQRDERLKAIKKARELAQRNAVLAGKGLADDDDDLDAKSWLKSQKKRQKKIEAERKAAEEKEAAEAARIAEHTAADLAGVKVAHDMATFLDGDDQVLTLKDTGVLENEEEGDELENVALREEEKLRERLDLKKKKPVYDPNDIDETGQIGILAHYDEEINGKKKKAFTLDSMGTSADLADILDSAPVQKRKRQVVDLDVLEDAPPPVSDYLDASEIKVKKPKKKKSKSTRQRRVDDDDALFPGDAADAGAADQEMDIDSGPNTFTKKRKIIDDNFVDDDDLQATLANQRKEALRKRKKTRPEDIARQLREETAQDTPDPDGAEGEESKGIVIDEISEFVETLRADQGEEERKRAKPKVEKKEAVTAMEDDSDDEMKDAADDHDAHDTSPALPDIPLGVEEEKRVDQGMGAALALLRERHLVEDQGASDKLEKIRQHEQFLSELRLRMAKFDEDTRVQRERDRASGKLDRMSQKEREEWARHQNQLREQHEAKIRNQLFNEKYKPTVELKYNDEDGREMNTKEAFKYMSHKFHGKGSGNAKTAKKLKKLAEEKRRMEQSAFDAGQSGGMSSAARDQGKKRREAGVRLA